MHRAFSYVVAKHLSTAKNSAWQVWSGVIISEVGGPDFHQFEPVGLEFVNSRADSRIGQRCVARAPGLAASRMKDFLLTLLHVIALIISQTFGVDIDNNVVYRVLAKHYRPAAGGTRPSWLSFIGHTQTASGAWTSFDVSRSCFGATGRLWSWTSSRVVSSASACIVAPPRAPTSAGCSTPPSIVRYTAVSQHRS